MRRQTLIVVFSEKDELSVNQLRKLVETNDDEAETVVGTRDGSVGIVPWTEKVWQQNKEAGILNEKVLLIDDIRGIDRLLPVVAMKYDRYGIQYGWAGDQAVLMIDEKALGTKASYEAFYAELQSKTESELVSDRKKVSARSVTKSIGLSLIPFAVFFSAANLIKNSFHDKKLVRQQMLLFGISEFYRNHLSQFLEE